jgi:nicotinamide-nucleotide amidase
MRVEIVAVGTELLLGQIADTNGQWLGEQLAAAGVDSHFHQVVGDNLERIVSAFRIGLSRSDALIVCGGLGPTQDDITREAIANVMGVELERREDLIEHIAAMFRSRDREMPANNLRQADVPVGADVIEQRLGTAPGLICPLGTQVIYAVPGVPYEMTEMFERAILPDLRRRMALAGESGVIASRVIKTWGTSESALAEALAERIVEIDAQRLPVTLAFLASGIEGLKVRVTARGNDDAHVVSLLDEEATRVEGILRERLGDVIFGYDEETMESAVAALLESRSLTLAVAESVTGGMICARLVNVPGASHWLKGGVVAYDSQVKYDLLFVPEGPVVSADAAIAMAKGVAKQLGADVGLGITGVAGPTPQEDLPPGTVFVGVALGDSATAAALRLPGDRVRIRDYATISALNALRQHLSTR